LTPTTRGSDMSLMYLVDYSNFESMPSVKKHTWTFKVFTTYLYNYIVINSNQQTFKGIVNNGVKRTLVYDFGQIDRFHFH
jgi:hypothetical protein